jgi:hypothetical protein
MNVLRALFDQPGLHIYPFVEIPLNTQLFHVDVAPVNNESRWQRFIFDEVENILEFASAEKIDEFRIHIQTRRAPDADYELKRILEVSKGDAISGESVYVFSCADGSTVISGFNGLRRSDIASVCRIWREHEIEE